MYILFYIDIYFDWIMFFFKLFAIYFWNKSLFLFLKIYAVFLFLMSSRQRTRGLSVKLELGQNEHITQHRRSWNSRDVGRMRAAYPLDHLRLIINDFNNWLSFMLKYNLTLMHQISVCLSVWPHLTQKRWQIR